MSIKIFHEPERPHVVVLGAGFGGLSAIRDLDDKPVDVTIIDQNNYHLFQPLLYQTATAGLAPYDIAYPVRRMLRHRRNEQFCLGRIQKIDLDHKRLYSENETIHYDYLIVAVGSVTNYFGIQSVEENGFTLKDLPDAEAIRIHLVRQFEAATREEDPQVRKALLTTTLVGGGPTGVELAGAISELYYHVMLRDYPDIPREDIHIILLEAMDRLLLMMPEDLSTYALKELEQKHVEIQFDKMVTGYDGKEVTFKEGEPLQTRTLIWTAGAKANPLLDTMDEPQGRLGRVKVAPTLQLPNYPEVFVIGDAAFLEDKEGTALPMLATVALQQGELAVKNMMHLLRNERLENFEYKNPGILATIGRSQAVAQLGKLKFTGWLAWMVWLVVHIYQLVGFRNRIVVFVNWIFQYIFYDRPLRIVSKEPEIAPEQEVEKEEETTHIS